MGELGDFARIDRLVAISTGIIAAPSSVYAGNYEFIRWNDFTRQRAIVESDDLEAREAPYVVS